jgi:tetratricopeptide (TPR) repeat protein/DNA-binding Xre family transcriptional regulator
MFLRRTPVRKGRPAGAELFCAGSGFIRIKFVGDGSGRNDIGRWYRRGDGGIVQAGKRASRTLTPIVVHFPAPRTLTSLEGGRYNEASAEERGRMGSRNESSSVGKNVDITKSGLPERLKRIREEKNVPPADLAEKAGITARTLRDIETGQRPRVQATTIHRLADALGVSYTDLLYGYRQRRYAPLAGVAALVLLAIAAFVVWRFPNRPDEHPSPYSPPATTRSHQAREQFVLGDKALRKLNREEARTHFRAALDIDSTFAMAAVRLTHPQIRGTREEARALIEQAKRHAAKGTDIERRYIESRDRYLRGDIEGAIAELQRLAIEHPEEKDAYALMGMYFSSTKRMEAAISSFEKALEIDPYDATMWNSLAYAREAVGDVDGALRACDEYIKSWPYEHNPYDTRGDILARHGKPGEAILEFKRALKLRPDFYPSMQYLGCISLLMRDYTRAETYFQNMTLTKNEGARGRGRLYTAAIPLYQGKLDEALVEIDRALAADRLENHNGPDHQHKIRFKAFVLAERGEFDEAIAESEIMLERVRDSDPNALPEWLDDHVYILARANKFDAARAALDSSGTLVREGPGNDNCYYWSARGWLDLELGDHEAACADFERAYDVEPMFYNGYPLGVAYIGAGRSGDAVTLFEKLVMRYKDERAAYPIEAVKMYYYLGIAYQETGRAQDAARMYRELLDTWKNADPVFDGVKSDARERLAQVVS